MVFLLRMIKIVAVVFHQSVCANAQQIARTAKYSLGKSVSSREVHIQPAESIWQNVGRGSDVTDSGNAAPQASSLKLNKAPLLAGGTGHFWNSFLPSSPNALLFSSFPL